MSSIFLLCHRPFGDDSKALRPSAAATVLAAEELRGHLPQHLGPWAAGTGVAGCVLVFGRAKAPSHVTLLPYKEML